MIRGMAVPERIGRFAVDGRIGGGAFASVYRAQDEALDSTVAIKVLSDNWLDSSDVRRRFLAEARLLRRAESDRIVRVHDLGELDDGRPYLVMTYADLGTLEERLDSPLPWRGAVQVGVEIAQALEVLHASGVLHRDIKPSNILYRTLPGGREQLMLGDLGLGKLLAEASMLTLAGGTPAFMAPEQARPGAPVSVRTDLYGVGSLLYRALTGRSTHDASTLTSVADPNRPPVLPPSSMVPGIPAELDRIVLRALAPDPDHRHADAAALVADLTRVLADPGPLGEVTMPVGTKTPPTIAPMRVTQYIPDAQLQSAPPQRPQPQWAPGPQRPSTPPQGMARQPQPTWHSPQPGPPSGPLPTQRQWAEPEPAPRKKKRWLIPLAVVLVLVLAASAAATYYFMTRDFTVTAAEGQLELTVPHDWGAEFTDNPWQTTTLVGGDATPDPQPALVVAGSVAGFSSLTDTRPGAFVGLLPPNTALTADKFRTTVTRQGCTADPTTLAGITETVSAVRQVCQAVVVDDLLLTRGGRQVWVQLKRQNNDRTDLVGLVNTLRVAPKQ